MLSDVGRLRALRNIAEHGSFSRAAEELGFTQSAISQQIAALEQEVGLTLLNRGVRPVALTDAGRTLAGYADGVLEQIATAEAQLDAIRGVRAGLLRLAAFPSAFATFVPAALARFQESHPGVRVQLVEAEPDVSLARLRAGEIDLAIAYRLGDADPDPTDGLDAVPLLDDELRAVLPARHRLARRDSVRLAELAGEPWIVPHAGGPARAYRELLERLWAGAGFTPRIAFETDDLQAVQAFVAAKLGVALMHDLTMPTLRRSVVARPLAEPALARRVIAITATGRRSPAAVAMLDVLSGA